MEINAHAIILDQLVYDLHNYIYVLYQCMVLAIENVCYMPMHGVEITVQNGAWALGTRTILRVAWGMLPHENLNSGIVDSQRVLVRPYDSKAFIFFLGGGGELEPPVPPVSLPICYIL